MLEWILHRPLHASNPSEIRVAERLKALGESLYTWTVIWGYYYQGAHDLGHGLSNFHLRERAIEFS